ncbi:MAG: SIS domain-containing protein [Saprospiraceae bacterium]
MLISDRLQTAIALKQTVLADKALLAQVDRAAQTCIDALRGDGTVLWCGNGGSAADAQHLSAELTGRFYYDRPPLRSEALHVNTSYLTAVGNDYGYDQVFERLARAQLRKGDVLIGLSTSGNSSNIVKALATARTLGAITIAFTGKGGGEMAQHADILIEIPSTDTPRIQEVHMFLGHCLCEIVEATMFPQEA